MYQKHQTARLQKALTLERILSVRSQFSQSHTRIYLLRWKKKFQPVGDVLNGRSTATVDSWREINTRPLGTIIDVKQRGCADSMFIRYRVSGLIILSLARARSHKSALAHAIDIVNIRGIDIGRFIRRLGNEMLKGARRDWPLGGIENGGFLLKGEHILSRGHLGVRSPAWRCRIIRHEYISAWACTHARFLRVHCYNRCIPHDSVVY